MKFRRACKVGLLSLLLSPLQAVAQSNYVVDDVIASDASGSVHGAAMPIGYGGGYFWARGDFGERPGVEGNYFSTGAMLPFQIYGPDDTFFVDSQMWVDEQAQIGGDVGVGYRSYLFNYSSVIGLNAGFTWDKSLLEESYRRVSFGAEFLTDYFGVTANAYIPVNDDPNNIGGPQYNGNNYFEDRFLMLGALQLVEQQLAGADIEAGTPIPGFEFLSIHGGGYYFSADAGDDVRGVSSRAVVDLTTAVLDLQIQNDNRFGTTVNFGAELRLGGQPFVFTPRYRNLQTKMFDRVRKRSRILTDRFLVNAPQFAINPATGLPFDFVHVENTAAAGGDGTNEARYNNLGLATGSGADIVLVHRGTTAFGNLLPGGGGLTLEDNQIVLGEGVPFQLQTANFTNPINLPDWNTGGASPFVTANAGANIITLANNNQVIGLNMIAPAGGNMIAGTNVNNFTIRDINIDVTAAQNTGAGGGILLTNATGAGSIRRFNMDSTSLASEGGIVIRNTNVGALNLTVNDSAFIEGGMRGVALVGNNSTINASFNNVHAVRNGAGLWLQAMNNGSVSAAVTNSSFDEAQTSHAVAIRGASGGQVNLAASNTTTSGAVIDNLNIRLDNAQASVSLANGSLSDAGGDAVDAQLLNGSQLFLSLTNMPATDAGGRGIALEVDGGSTLQMPLLNVDFSRAGGAGLIADVTAGSTFVSSITNGSFQDSDEGIAVLLNGSTGSLSLENVDLSGALGGDAFRFLAENSSTFNAQLNGVQLDDADGSALRGSVIGMASSATILGNNVSGARAGGDAINLFNNFGQLNVTLLNSTNFADAGGDAIDLVTSNGGVSNLSFAGGLVDFSGAGEHGLFVRTGTNATATVQFNDGASFDGAQGLVAGTGNALHISSVNGGTSTVVGNNVSGAGAANHGIFVRASDGQSNLFLTEAGSFAGAGANGLQYRATNGGDVNINIAGTALNPASFDGATGAGVNGSLENSSAFVVLSDVSADSAGTNAFALTATNSEFTGLVQNGVFSNAGMHALTLNALGGSSVALLAEGIDGTFATGGDGFRAVANNSELAVEIHDAAFDDANQHALHIVSSNGADVEIVGTGISGARAGLDGIHIESDSSRTIVNLTSLGSFANAGNNGVDVSVSNGAFPDFSLTLAGAPGAPANFTGAGGDGLRMEFTNYVGFHAAQRTFVFDRLNFNGALGGDGFRLISTDSTFNGLVTNSSFNNAAQHAFHADLTGNSPLSRILFQDTTMSGAAVNAVNIDVQNNTLFDVDIIDGDLSGSGGAAVVVTQDAGSMVDLFIDPTAIDRGFEFFGANGTHLQAHLQLSPLSTLAGPAQFGIIGELQSGATMNLIVESSEIDHPVLDGVNVTASGKSSFFATFIDSDITDAGRHGVQLNLDDSFARMDFTQGSNITNSGASNVLVHAENGARAVLNFDATSSDVSGAGVDGMFLRAVGANSAIDVNFAGLANLDDAGRDGLSLISNNGGRVNVNALQGLSIQNAGDNAVSIFGNGGNATLNADNVTLSSVNHALLSNTGLGSRTIIKMTDVAEIESQTGDAVRFNVNDSFLAVNLSGNPVTPMQLSGLGGSGVNGNAVNGAEVVLKLDEFRIENSQNSGIALNLNDSSLRTSTLTNGLIRNNGQGGGSSAGIDILADNGASVGLRGNSEFGLHMDNLRIDNLGGLTQDHGLRIVANGDSFVRSRLVNSTIENHASHGVLVDVNPDQTPLDNSLVDLTLSTVNVMKNQGDGVNLTAAFGNNTINSVTSGIFLNVLGGEISGNGNGVLGDGLGDGIEANVIGDPFGVANNTTILLNLFNADVHGNEEMDVNLNSSGGGSVNQNVTGGSVEGPVTLIADGANSTATLTLDNVLITPATSGGGTPNGAAIVMHALNGGFVNGNFLNMNAANGTAISGHGGQAVAFLAESAGTISASFTNVDMIDNLKNPLLFAEPITGLSTTAAVRGIVRDNNSLAEVNFTNVNITDNAGAGLEVDAINGGSFATTIRNLTLARNDANPAAGDFDVNVFGNGSSMLLDVEGLSVNGSQGTGINITAGGAAELEIAQFRNISANNAAAGGFNLVVNSGAVLNGPFHLENGTFNNAQNGDGVNIDINTTANPFAADISLTNVFANNARFNGVDINISGSADGGAHAIALDGVSGNGAQGGRGLNVRVDGLLAGEAAQVSLNNGTFNNASVSGIDIQLNGAAGMPGVGSLGSVDISNVTAHAAGTATGVNLFFGNGIDVQHVHLANVSAINAATHGLSVRTQGSATRLRELLVGGDFNNFSGAGFNGAHLVLDAQSVPADILLQNLTANNAGGKGVNISLDNVRGGESSVVLEQVIANNAAGGPGLDLKILGLDAADSAVVAIGNGSSFNNAAGDGVNLELDGLAGAAATLEIDGLAASNAGGHAIDIQLGDAISLSVDALDNVSASNAAGHGLNLEVLGDTQLTKLHSQTANFSNAGGSGVNLWIDAQNAPVDIQMNGLSANNAGGKGVNIQLDAVTGGVSTVSLTNVSATGAQGGAGLDLDITGLGATDGVDIALSGDFSNAAADAVNILVEGAAGSTAEVAISNLTASGAGDDGFDLTLDGGVTANIASFNTVTASNNEENGLKFAIINGSVLTDLTANGLQVSGNGTSGAGFDGIDVLVDGAGSAATFNLSNIAVNNSGGRGIDLDVLNGGQLTFNVVNGVIANSGLQGLDIDVGVRDEFGTPSVIAGDGHFTGLFQDLTVSNSGQFLTATADGINVNVHGNGVAGGSTADVTFDHVVSNGSDEDGIDIRILDGADGRFAITNASGASNNTGGRGLNFQADGAMTTASLNMTAGLLGTNTFHNNATGSGVRVSLTNGVQVDDLVINASANGNAQDGIRILATDNTGVNINNFSVAGAQANNNVGNGLFLDLRNVGGINAFSMTSATFSGNGGDQVFARFREMTLTDVSLTNVTVTGQAGSGDGIELNLLDTEITGTLAIDGLHARNNGERGLNLVVNESGIDDGQTAGVNVGYITNSEFTGNGMAGARLLFGGDSVSDFDIFNNTGGQLGFRNNLGAGLRIDVQDNATFTIAGVNSQDGSTQSFFNNLLSGNGSFGFLLHAREPSDPNPVDIDGIGPTYVLELGDPLRNPNVMTGNRDAALAIIGENDSVGSFSITNALLTNTLAGSVSGFNGDGLAIRLSNRAILTDFEVDGALAGLSLNNNAGSGIAVTTAGFSRFGTNSHMTVINTTISGNSRHGIEIQRNDNSLFGVDGNNSRIIIGQQDNGNTFSNNTLDGVNIINRNQPGAPIPLDLQIEDNTFINNRDGVYLTGTGNAQFTGQISDNEFLSHNRDGIHVQLENQAALGDPNGAGLDPFVMAGNQILGDAASRYGIYFDTNYTNENGLFGGTAFVHVDIRDSLVQTDLFGEFVRTQITGHGQHGVLIRDNSQYAGSLLTNPVIQNTYQIRATDITNNLIDGIHVEQGVNTLPGGPSLGAVRDGNAGIAVQIGDEFGAAVGNRDVVIANNGDDGIHLHLLDGDINANLFTLNRVTIQMNGFNGDGVNALNANAGHGIEVNMPQRGGNIDGGRIVAFLENVDILQNAGHGMDWELGTNRAGEVARVVMTGLTSALNGERGLNAFLHHDRSTQTALNGQNSSVWSLGTAEDLTDASRNYFTQNGREGMVFDIRTDSLDQRTVNVPASGLHGDLNKDVFVEGNLNYLGPLPNRYSPSTEHPVVGVSEIHDPLDPLFRDLEETSIHMVVRVNLINNEITNNGGVQGFEDGASFGISAMSRLNLMVAANTFGGNVGDDLRVYPQRPTAPDGTNLDPPQSQNNGPPTPTGGSLNLPQNFLVYDPVAYIDMVLGSLDTGVTAANPHGSGAVTVDAAYGNTGNQISILPNGTNQTTQITTDGVWQNIDPIKNPSGFLRTVVLAGRIIVDGEFQDTTLNNFVENGVQQNIGAQFTAFEWDNSLTFPETPFDWFAF